MKSIEWIRGRFVLDVTRDADGTSFYFDGGGVLRVECFWRIVTKGRVWLTSRDDQKTFGLPSPDDAGPAAVGMMIARALRQCEFSPDTGDLTLFCEQDVRLECICDTSGVARWGLTAPDGKLVMPRRDGGLAEA